MWTVDAGRWAAIVSRYVGNDAAAGLATIS